ncbi:MAG TPA: NVEALA domain-containing protein [Candidatus Phocaeicola caecigallinarum]|nr:NVEALA domain-containing protein [Candidatus Phocaeicola caecigallinarum]
MKNILKTMAVVACVFVAGYNTFTVQEKGNGYVAMTLDNVEAVAACEVSSDSSKNKGVCERDVNGTEDYCVRSNWGIQCCATIY